MTMSIVPNPAAPGQPDTTPRPATEAPKRLTCTAAEVVATVINTVWKDCAVAEPAVDAAFEDLIAGFSGVLPECWPRRRFNLVCTSGIEV